MKANAETVNRIRRLWSHNGHRPRVHPVKASLTLDDQIVTYPASSITATSSDFVGDWRSVDAWQRIDLQRVRARSRQLERGNPLCIAFKRNMLNNILGARGFHERVAVVSSSAYGDATDGQPDASAIAAIERVRKDFGREENFSASRRLCRRDADRLWLARLMFDGEVIVRKVRGYPNNDYGFTWQFINPDYLDHTLNRIEPNGNVISMGVEVDPDYKFPVAYWFLRVRPNGFFFNDPKQFSNSRYYRVPAEEIIHTYLMTEDEEQTRGWPWVFAAAMTLFRLGKYQESALINAAIGAARGVYFTKKYPDGFVGDPRELDDDANIEIDLPQGSGLELPYGVEPKVVDMQYPDNEFEGFCNAMMLTASMVFGTSYATTTGDLSKANFVSSRMGQLEEREQYMAIQEFMIDKWKKPGAGEELYRALLSRQLNLPISRFPKFNQIEFVGRRWKFVQPVDDMKAKEIGLNNLTTSISDIVAETSQEDIETVFERIAKDNALMKKYGLERVISTGGKSDPAEDPAPPDPAD